MTFHARRSVSLPAAGDTKSVAFIDLGYPDRLRSIASPPPVLWITGRAPRLGEKIVAIVGARAASRRGCDTAHELAFGLGSGGTSIVSGGAFGIDAAAHEGCLAAHAATYAVLGCGVDVVYPDRHADLFARVARSGGLLSEYRPATPPRRGQFPARNRIIAGLAHAVVVVEAAARSGALITARLGRAFSRPVFVVPGSPGTDACLRGGWALPVRSASDVECLLAGGRPSPVISEATSAAPAEGPMAALVEAIASGVDSPVRLGRHLGVPLPAVLALLAEAELEGCVARAAGNTYEVIARVC